MPLCWRPIAPAYRGQTADPGARARQAAGDPRLSIEERYLSKEDYLGQVKHAAEALVQQGYLLAEDLPTITEQAAQCYDRFRRVMGAAKG